MKPDGGRVLLVGWDAAEWGIIHPLIDDGKSPALDSLLSTGVSGQLISNAALPSAALWTTIATGMGAERHGVLTAVEEDPVAGGLRTVGSGALSTQPIWTLLGRRGLRSHVVNWPATSPPPPVTGVAVPDAFFNGSTAFEPDEERPFAAVYPVERATDLAPFLVHPEELVAQHILPFVPQAAEVDQERDPRLAIVASALARSTSVHAVATWILENESWDFAAVRYAELGAVTRHFMAYHPPRPEHVSEKDFSLYRDVLTAFYVYYDMMLARLITLAGADATIVLVSQHGANLRWVHEGPRKRARDPFGRNWRRNQGVLVVKGPRTRSDELLRGARLADIAPTVLALFGLPSGEDMAGRPLLEAFAEPPPAATIASWEAEPGSGESQKTVEPERADDIDMALGALAVLGHNDPFEAATPKIRKALGQRREFNRARALIGAGRYEEALPILEALVESLPEAAAFSLALAHCYYLAGNREKCRRIAVEVVDSQIEGPLTDLLRGYLAHLEGNYAEALEWIDKAIRGDPESPELHCQRARFLSLMDRDEEAKTELRAALDADPDFARAFIGLAVLARKQGCFNEAVEHAENCLARDPDNVEAHYIIAEGHARRGYLRQAVKIFETCLRLRPGWQPAREKLRRHAEGLARSAMNADADTERAHDRA